MVFVVEAVVEVKYNLVKASNIKAQFTATITINFGHKEVDSYFQEKGI